MNKYIFSRELGKETEKFEILAEDLEDALSQLKELVGDVFTPDYVEPTEPADLKLKTFNITYWPDPDDDETDTITYAAKDLQSATGKFIADFPEQAGKQRETHSPLSNYAVDAENEESSVETSSESVVESSDKSTETTEKVPASVIFAELFTKVTDWVKLVTVLLFSFIGLDLVAAALFGPEQSLGVVENITTLLANNNGLGGLIVLFLVYFLFIRNVKKKT